MSQETQTRSRPHEAVVTYLRLGDRPVGRYALEACAQDMEMADLSIADQHIKAGLYLDIAQHPDIPRWERRRAFYAYESTTKAIVSTDWRTLREQDRYSYFMASLSYAYRDKYLEVICDYEPTLAHEIMLSRRLINTANEISVAFEQALRSKHDETKDRVGELKGVLFETSIHLLNARLNLRHEEILHHVWPSLPRQDSPFGSHGQYNPAWDMGSSPTSFWDPSKRLVQLKYNGHRAYRPDINVVSGKLDLKMKEPTDIIMHINREVAATPGTEELVAISQSALNEYEKKYLERLGWEYPDQ